MTSNDLYNLMISGGLTAGDMYAVTDYQNLVLTTTALSNNTLDTEWESGDYIAQYDLQSKKILYLANLSTIVEGYFDWRNSVIDCYDVSIGKGSENIYLNNCHNIQIGEDNISVDMVDCNNITIGRNNDLRASDSEFITIMDNNTIVLQNASRVSLNSKNNIVLNDIKEVFLLDDNENVTISDGNVIGSNNKDITIVGSGNVVGYDCSGVDITGNNNKVNASRLVEITANSNNVERSYAVFLNNSSSNEVTHSDSVDVYNTNNNYCYVKTIQIDSKPAFFDYTQIGNIKRVRNLVGSINLQADDYATVLDVSKQTIEEYPNRVYHKSSNGQWIK